MTTLTHATTAPPVLAALAQPAHAARGGVRETQTGVAAAAYVDVPLPAAGDGVGRTIIHLFVAGDNISA